MQRDADSSLSNNEKQFIIQALKEERRIDGRGPYEMREAKFQFSLDDTSCTVLLGHTRVMTVITATLEAPYPDRPNEGSIRFNVEFSPMASPAFEAGRPGEEAIELARLIERGLRDSRAVDQEALVVVSGRKVWHLRVDVHVLDHCGNLTDACGLSALAALMAFRRPDITVGGGEDGQAITVHSPEVREPLPLSIHHLPVPVTFALFEDGLMVVDPGLKEEAASSGGLTVTLNPHGELCAVQKARGVGLPTSEIMRCIRLAAKQVEDLASKLKKALEAHAIARVQARVRRRAPQPGDQPPAAAQQAQQAQQAAALPQPVQEILRELDQEEEDLEEDGEDGGEDESQDADMAAAAAASDGEGQQTAAAGGGGEDGVPREGAAGEGGAGAMEVEGAGEPKQQQQQQQQEQQQLSKERRKEKRKRRSAGQLSGGGGQQQQPDAFEVIASMIAGAGAKGPQQQQQQQQGQGGLEGAVKQRDASSSGGKKDKGPRQ